MQEQEEILAQGSLQRIEDLLHLVKEEGSMSPYSVSSISCTQDRQPDVADLLTWEEPTVENWDRIYQEEDHLGRSG
jgi:hypothetical protein